MSVTQKEIVSTLHELADFCGVRTNFSTEKYARNLADRIHKYGIAPPDGYAIVPSEPTKKMAEAARQWQYTKYVSDPLGNKDRFYDGIYRAMLTAAKESV